jgi:tRNA(Arg) A34 adenosine deaminase TadA
MENTHEYYMELAIKQAAQAKTLGDWPFGAVVVKDGKVVGEGRAMDKVSGDVTDHAELVAIRQACKTLGTNNLESCTIYCSNEPCLMCASGIFQAKISHIVIGASRDDLSRLLRPRKIRIEDLAEDAGHTIHITKNILKEKVLELFQDIKKD